ncbi:carboxypeptidase-like regulatory domain-containing protein [Pedobacter agri]|uniref:carboxypeptidase-like regulatory domain-containing protein n=1 Tax=Pedobacter agri TaxID=454586 RepID=UPI00292D848A|nr:carboxypeptidase-like regulatory domain-containing protein [Pedobacter agri]
MVLLFAQNSLSISGSVKDSIGNPIASASVAVVNQNGAGITFSTTNDKGLFKCDFQSSNENYFIKVTAIGFQLFSKTIEQKHGQHLSVMLKQTSYKLAEVTIKSNNKISLSSDTLKYSVKGFQESNDRVIGDVINRLPGIKVDENGAISYNGKRITNVYIDGDNLLDGRYKMATNNVPVGAVEQVQVIERDQPIKALNGYVSSNNVSLNIKLTDSARTMMVNSGYVGAGNKAYTGELNNLIFDKKIKAINTFKANNIGENLEAEQASLGQTFNNEISLKMPQTFLSMESENLPNMKEKYYLLNNDNSGSLNALVKLKADWGLRLNLSTLQLKRKYQYNNAVNYFLGNADTIRFNETQDNVYKLNQWHAEAQLEKNSKSIYLKNITKFEIPKWNRNGNTIQNEKGFGQSQPTNQLSISNETSVVKALGVNNILQYNGLVQYYKVEENLNITPGIQKGIVNNGIDYLSLNQQASTKNLFVNQSATFKTKFNRFVLSAAAGISYEQNQLLSNLYKTDSTNNTVLVGNQFKNDVIFDQLGLYAKISALYLLEKGSINVEASPTFSNINYTDSDRGSSNKNNYFLLNPIIEFKKILGKYSELNGRFAQQTQFGQVNDIYNGGILVNYRQFNVNNRPLPKTDITNFNVRYAYRKPIKMLFYNFIFSYDKTRQNFINSFTIDSGLTESIAIDFQNKTHQYSLSGNISKYVFPLELNFSANGSLRMQKGNSFYNEEITPFKTYQMSTGFSLRKKLLSKITISIVGDLSKSINKQESLSGIITNETANEKIKGEWLQNLSEEISYSVSYNFVSYRQSLHQPVRNQFLDLNLKFAPTHWKSFFEFQCINLMDQQNYQQINSTANQLSVYQMPLRPRTFLIKYFFTL